MYTMKKMHLFLCLFLLWFQTGILGQSAGQSLTYFYDLENKDSSAFQILGIPVKYPMELTWSKEFKEHIFIPTSSSHSLTWTSMKYTFPKKEQSVQIETYTTWVEPTLQNLRPVHYEVNLLSQKINPLTSKAHALMVSYSTQKVTMLLNFAASFGIDPSGHTSYESSLAQLGIRFHVKPSIFAYKSLYAGLNVGVQQLDFQQWEDKFRKIDVKSKANAYLTPGLTIGGKTFVFEGLIRLPIQNYGNENDQLLKPEVQGRLGLKWNLPEIIRP
jgi:hypothetical protein